LLKTRVDPFYPAEALNNMPVEFETTVNVVFARNR
jgi:hypothetical protein